MNNKCYYQIEKENVAVVYFDNPPLNALDEQVMEAFKDVMNKLIQDSTVHGKWKTIFNYKRDCIRQNVILCCKRL